MASDSGIGTYLRSLVPRLTAAREDWAFTILGDPARPEALNWNSAANVRVHSARARIYSVAEQLELAYIARRVPRADLFWAPHYNMPLAWPGPVAVTVHDVAHLALPELLSAPKRAYARAMFRAVRRRAAAVICVSNFTRDELLRLVPGPGADPQVVHSGLDSSWFQTPAGGSPHRSPKPYLLYAGNVKPHKNLGALLRAFAAVRDRVPHDLVLVGRAEGFRTGDPEVPRLAAALGDRVVIRGEVPLGLLRRYMAHASLFVMPSLYEGFGFPPLEAMASGCPCLVSSAGALPEICGDAAEFFDPRGADLAERMVRLLGDVDERARLVTTGRSHAARYDWDRSAAETADVLERAMAFAQQPSLA